MIKLDNEALLSFRSLDHIGVGSISLQINLWKMVEFYKLNKRIKITKVEKSSVMKMKKLSLRPNSQK